MPTKKLQRKPPSQRPGRRPGGLHRYKPLRLAPSMLDATYLQTWSRESPEPVVLLLNLDDPNGDEILREIAGSRSYQRLREESCDGPDAPSIGLGIKNAEDAATILLPHFECAMELLETPIPPGHYRVVVIDVGEMRCLSRPIPAPGRFELIED